MPEANELFDRLPVEARERIERLVESYERDWLEGRRPTVEERLPPDGPERLAALVELLHAELEWKQRKGEGPTPEGYVLRFPELALQPDVLRDLFSRHRQLCGHLEPTAPPLTHHPRGTGTHVVLEVIQGPHSGDRFEFDGHALFVVGRASTAHLSLPDDRSLSRHHFLLEINPPRCFLRDLGSRNGTILNGQRIRETFLEDGAVFGGGRTLLRLTVNRPDGHVGRPALSCSRCGAGFLEDTLSEPSTPMSMLLCDACRREARESPQVIPGYNLVRKLGQGGMGVVYLAERVATGQNVALKLIIPEVACSERMVQTFLREVSVLSKLDHPRIVRFHEVGMARGQFFFAMDHVETVDLKATLMGLSPPSRIKAACGVLCQVLDALHYAHGLGFVHRDVKPSNLLVSREGRKLRVKLGDFGLAKNFETSGFSGMTHTTHVGELRGSFPYMAPEQVLDCRTARPPADVYSAGATLYQLLTGQAPHVYPRDRDAVLVVLEDAFVPLPVRLPEAPIGLADLVHRSLAREPGARFATAAEFREQLLPFARGS